MPFPFDYKFFIKAELPWIHMAAQQFKDKEPGTTSKNEYIGISLDYAASIIEAVISDKPIPKAPAALVSK